MATRLRALVLVSCFLAGCQAQLQLIQGINHPGGPNMAPPQQPDIGLAGDPTRGLVDLDKSESLPSVPKDALVDPTGKAFAVRKPKIERVEEEEVSALELEVQRIRNEKLTTWVFTLLGCLAVVGCGVLPAYLLPLDAGEAIHRPETAQKLNLLLSFAVGSLLGDVFLHILPESWASNDTSLLMIGAWVIAGLLLCFIVEKCCATTEDSQHRICAFMNLAANLVDNFTHGLAVGGSFLVNVKFGLLTTLAILVHEIPHEISDFAILLRGDFNRWSAVKAQLLTASGGVVGASMALLLNSDAMQDSATAWILPFTAGGFLNIALAQILPDIMQEKNPRESVKQLFFILLGIICMAAVNQLHFV